VTVNVHAVKTFLLALVAAVSFVAAIVVGLGYSVKKAPFDEGARAISRTH
jgi:NADH:ubiquinone oxidoreductase subunit 3 (subunit A)